jgi:hypothetical protein
MKKSLALHLDCGTITFKQCGTDRELSGGELCG